MMMNDQWVAEEDNLKERADKLEVTKYEANLRYSSSSSISSALIISKFSLLFFIILKR